MAVLIIKNIISEGPGTIKDFLKKEDIPYTIVELHAGEIPPPLEGFNTLIVMGGPMGVYEMDKYPHLIVESRIIREAINRFKVFQWHSDTFDLPLGAILLASSKRYKNQAFRYGDNIYAFQFHIEITKDMLLEWFKDMPEREQIMAETEKIYDEYTGRAMNFYKAFFRRE